MRWLVLCALLGFNGFANAQNLDSLKNLLSQKSLPDSSRSLLLSDLSYELRRSNPDSSLLLANQSLELSEKIRYEKGRGRALRMIGIYRFLRSDNKGALPYYKQALEIGLKVNDQKSVANCYNNIGTIYHSQNDYKEAVTYFTKAMIIRKQISDYRGIAQAFSNLGSVNLDQSRYDSASRSFEKALRYYEKINDKEGIASSYRSIGSVYRMRGNSSEALKYFLISLDKRKNTLSDKPGLAFLYNDLGNIYKERGDFENALRYFFDALRIQEEVGSLQGIAASQNNIGNIYLDQGDFEKALEYFESSLKIKKEIGNQMGIAHSYNEIGAVYLGMNQLSKAADNMNLALAIQEKINDRYGIASTCARLADISLVTRDYKKAFALLERGLKIAEDIKSDIQISGIHSRFAKYYNAINQPAKAYSYSQSAFELASKMDNIELMRNAVEQKAMAAEQLGKYKEALENHKLFVKYNDSIQDLNSLKKSLSMEFLFKDEKAKIEANNKELALRADTEKQKRISYTLIGVVSAMAIIALLAFRSYYLKRNANRILTRQKAEVETAHAELAKSDSIKNRLLSIISHDVRGPLNSLKGTLYLFNNNALSQTELKNVTQQLGDQVSQLSNFLENLLRWTRGQMSDIKPSPKNIDVTELVNETITLLSFQAQSKNIEVRTSVPDGTFIFADEEMMKTVLRNLTENAIKFCKVGDRLTIRAWMNDSIVSIAVEDTGQGISADQISKLFETNHLSTKGTQDELGTGLGLALCKEFVEKNHGHISVESVPGKGSVFQFSVPKGVGFQAQSA